MKTGFGPKKRSSSRRPLHHFRDLAGASDVRETSHGPSSFHMQDPEKVFECLDLREGHVFLDLGCGAGDFALRAAELVGAGGTVHALDVDPRCVQLLAEEARDLGLDTLRALAGTVEEPLPFETDSIDVCLIAQVLHALKGRTASFNHVFAEVRRLLRKEGILVVIECKKVDALFGPPLSVRLAPEELVPIASANGFHRSTLHDLGVNYLLRFPAADGGPQ